MAGGGDWQQAFDRFRKTPSPGAWMLPRDRVADDLSAVIEAPDSVNQGPFAFCGIAAFARFWMRRDAAAFAAFAIGLYNQGTATIGSVTVTPNAALRRRDYLADLARDDRCPPGQWMVMGAIQDHISLGGFDGTADHSWTRFIDLHEGSNPRDLVPLLKGTELYASVDKRVDWTSIVIPRLPWDPFPRPTLGDALALRPSATCDVILLINDAFLAGSAVPAGWIDRLALDFPNHYVALERPLSVDGGYVDGAVWTWAGSQDLHVREAQFVRNFYGSVVATV